MSVDVQSISPLVYFSLMSSKSRRVSADNLLNHVRGVAFGIALTAFRSLFAIHFPLLGFSLLAVFRSPRLASFLISLAARGLALIM
jgi:hypothetical protein